MLSLGLLVVHDTVWGSQDELTELTRWEEIRSDLLNLGKSNVESWGDDAALVQTTKEVNDDLTRSVVIDDLEITNVTYETNRSTPNYRLHTVLLHDLEKLDNDLRTWADENL